MISLKIALASATGLLGKPFVSALLNADQAVLILTRQGSTSTSTLPQSPLITVKEVDYKSIDFLKAALQGIDVVISTLAAVGLGDQLNLVNAAFDAGVKRFIPSEFGSDTSKPQPHQPARLRRQNSQRKQTQRAGFAKP